MAKISLFYLNTTSFSLTPLHTIGLPSESTSIDSELHMPDGVEYVLLFVNVDGVVSQGPLTVPADAGFATGYYGLKGTIWVTPGIGGAAGSGPTPVSDSYVQVVGFDATADTLALVTFTLLQQEAGEIGGLLDPLQQLEAEGAFGFVLPNPVASGTAIQTTTNGATVTAPETDAVTRFTDNEAAVFSYRYNVSTGEKPFTDLPSSGPLTLAAGTGGLFLAVYTTARKTFRSKWLR
jgi:hypothetical protein